MNPIFTQGNWIVCFHNGGPRNWWDIFTRPGYRHCFALRYLLDLDAWVLVDWSNTGLAIEFLPKRFIDGIIAHVNDTGGAFLEVKATPLPRRILPLSPLYCVSAMKELVGFKSWHVVTPYQLYCALMKRGAKRMFNLKPQLKGKDYGKQRSKGTTTRSRVRKAESSRV